MTKPLEHPTLAYSVLLPHPSHTCLPYVSHPVMCSCVLVSVYLPLYRSSRCVAPSIVSPLPSYHSTHYLAHPIVSPTPLYRPSRYVSPPVMCPLPLCRPSHYISDALPDSTCSQ